MWVEVICWIYRVWSFKECACCACDPSMHVSVPSFWASRPCGPAGWLALLLTKAGDVETNPGPTTLNKRVWIGDICYNQIHVRKQISIRCNRIEHWVHLRCADIRQAQYTDTCHLYIESTHNSHRHNTTNPSRPWSKPPTRFCEEQRQPSIRSAWPACRKRKIRPPLLGAGGFDTICTAICDRCDSSTTCTVGCVIWATREGLSLHHTKRHP